MVNQKVVVEIASVVYATATYLVLKDNLMSFLKDKNDNDVKEESSKVIKNEESDRELTDDIED